MATKVLKELAVAVSTYEDRSTGQQKNRYRNIGVLMESTNDRGEANQFLMLNRDFNPAGVPFKAGSDKILISMFDPRDNSQGGQSSNQSSGGNQQQSDRNGGYGSGGRPGGSSDYDSEIPFQREDRA